MVVWVRPISTPFVVLQTACMHPLLLFVVYKFVLIPPHLIIPLRHLCGGIANVYLLLEVEWILGWSSSPVHFLC